MNDKEKIRIIKKLLDDASEAQWEGETAWYMIAIAIFLIVNMDEEEQE